MQKNKGFTLIELLAVIVILGILVSFSTVAISKIKKNQDKKNYENVISSILTGAKAYNAEERINDSIYVSDLIDTDYVDFDQIKYNDLVDAIVKKTICENNKLKVKYSLNGYNDCGCEIQEVKISDELCKEE